MRRIIACASVCLLALGLVGGLVMSTATAAVPCTVDCVSELYCTLEINSACFYDPDGPYIVYRIWTCPNYAPSPCPEEDGIACCWDGNGLCTCFSPLPVIPNLD